MNVLEPRMDDAAATSAPAVARSTTQLSRQQILEATFACLREEGYDNTTIRRIAKRLDCAIGSIYRYYRDKRELLYVVTQELLAPVVERLEMGASFDESRQLYHQLATAEVESYRLMFWLAVHTEPSDPARLPGVIHRLLDHWTRQLNSADRARAAWAQLHGQCMLGPTGTGLIASEATHAAVAPAAPHASEGQLPGAGARPQPQVVIPADVRVPTPSAISKAAKPDDVVLL